MDGWRPRIIGLAIVAVLLGAGCSDNGSTASPAGDDSQTAAASPTSPSPIPCIDESELFSHRDASSKQLKASVRDMRAFDLDSASAAVRIAASETRSMADAVAEVNPGAQAHLLRAADAFDESASAMSDGDISDAIGWMEQATNEIKQAVDAIDPSEYC